MAEKAVPPVIMGELRQKIMEVFGFDIEKNLLLKHHVGKFVKVKTANSEEHLGWMKCLDPNSGNFFLIKLDDTITKVIGVKLITGFNWRTSEVVKEPSERVTALLANMDKSIAGISAAFIPDRKLRLLAWIKKNRLPVKERDDHSLVVGGNVIISPPYEIENCASPNSITLTNIRHLVAQLPSSIDEEAAKLAKRREKARLRREKSYLKRLNKKKLDQEKLGQEDKENSGKENSSQEDSDQENSNQEGADQEDANQENADQEDANEKDGDQENADEVDGNEEEGSYEEDADEEGSYEEDADEEGSYEEGSYEEWSDQEGSDQENQKNSEKCI